MSGALPSDGPVTVGGVALPAGRSVDEFLWSTVEPPDDALGLWSALAARFSQTALRPVVVFGYAGYGVRVRGMGGASLHLHVQRPPHGDDIIKTAAELRAFCRGMDGDPATMAAQPLWSFWWD